MLGLGQHEQEFVVDTDRLVDLIDTLAAPSHVLGRIPNAEFLLEIHGGKKTIGERLVLSADLQQKVGTAWSPLHLRCDHYLSKNLCEP